MEENKVIQFLLMNRDKFPAERVPMIKDMLFKADENRFLMIASTEYKDTTTMLLISIFIGELGIDRFLLEDVGLGVLKLLTFGGCGIWWIIDLINIQRMTREYNFKKLQQMAMY